MDSIEKQKLLEKLAVITEEVKMVPEGEELQVHNQFGDVLETVNIFQDENMKWHFLLKENWQDN